MDPAVIAVITSGVIALVALLAPIISTLVADSLKWQREQKAAEEDTIATATTDLLALLAIFRSGQVLAASGQSEKKVYSNLLARYYAWEQRKNRPVSSRRAVFFWQ